MFGFENSRKKPKVEKGHEVDAKEHMELEKALKGTSTGGGTLTQNMLAQMRAGTNQLEERSNDENLGGKEDYI